MSCRVDQFLWTVIASCTIMGFCFAQDVSRASEMLNSAAGLLKSRDPDLAGEGVRRVRPLLGLSASADHVELLRRQWLPALAAGRQHGYIVELVELGMQARSNSPAVLEELARARVRALLVAGKHGQALSAAKGVYNLATMGGTREAIDIFAEALQAANPADKSIARRFKLQQLSDGLARGEEPLIKGVEGEAEPYLSWINHYSDKTFAGLTTRGNLYLLADRSKEARDAFEKAYALASDAQLPTATESLARVMKAEDGNILRAHAFVVRLGKTAAK